MNLAEVTAKNPVNKTAAMVTSKGVEYVCTKNIQAAHWEIPPAMIKLPQNMPDLAGRKLGRLAVIGLLRSKGRGKGSVWLVRCDCGRYTSRVSSTINAARDPEDCCEECRQLNFTKRRQYFFEHGIDRDELDQKLDRKGSQ